MASGALQPPKLAGTPELIFRWRSAKSSFFPKLVALALATALFSLLLSVRVRLKTPERDISGKASMIYLGNDPESRALALRATEGGPFPSKFELSQWEGLAEIEAAAVDAVRFQPSSYTPALPDLPSANQLAPLELAAKGQTFFPKRAASSAPIPDAGKVRPAPSLHPLSAIASEALPSDLPPFDGAVDAVSSPSWPAWKFLIRLTPDGGVAECISLEKGGQPTAPQLEAWLRRIPFKPEPAKPSRWIAVGIGFANQPADGTDAR